MLLAKYLFLSTLFFVSSTLLSLSNGASSSPILPYTQFLGTNNEYPQWIQGSKRLVLEEENNTTLILAANKTRRKDPLQNFNYYTGGWDYKSVHYWASVSFSASPLFITAIVWFVGLGLSLLCYCVCCCCCRKLNYGYSRVGYALSLFFLVLFTISTFSGCVVLYINQKNFHNSVAYTFEYIVKRGISIFENFMSIVKALVAAKNVTLNQISLPESLRTQIDVVDEMINATSNVPKYQSIANSLIVGRVLDPARLALNIVAAIMLTFVLLGFLFSVYGLQFFVFILVIIGWILITLTLILCGVFLIFHNVVADTCFAMGDWLENPTANAAISLQILPCMDNATSQQTLNATKQTTSYLIHILNQYIQDVSNNDLPSQTGVLYYNQSGPLAPLLCNPFYPNMTDRKCSPDEVGFNNFEQEWKKYVCEVSATNICTTEGRFTPNVYDQLTSNANVSYSLFRSGPFLVELGDCTFVLETFSDISKYYCPKLRRYSYRTYVGLLIVAISVMCSLVVWIYYARERRRRKYTKKFDGFTQR